MQAKYISILIYENTKIIIILLAFDLGDPTKPGPGAYGK